MMGGGGFWEGWVLLLLAGYGLLNCRGRHACGEEDNSIEKGN
jgi:hypothetical protein